MNTVIESLNKLLDSCTQRELAAKIGVPPAYLNDVLAERRRPGKKILRALGYEKATIYKKKA